ncbi:antitoxin [Kribbella sp. NPDC051770]|uniref:antitoxin n=1 Tax=Kribbella sp. NPDC051770 TaxID=3155413 RepID=UPI00343D3461
MNDFQEQAKNWLRNVVKQNPDKIKAGVEKAGDLIDKQTGGKYAEKVDSVQQKVGNYVDSQTGEQTEQTEGQPPTGPDDGAPEAGSQAQDAGDSGPGAVVGGEAPDVSESDASSAGSRTEGAETGGTATGTSDGGLPGPR